LAVRVFDPVLRRTDGGGEDENSEKTEGDFDRIHRICRNFRIGRRGTRAAGLTKVSWPERGTCL